MNGSRALGVALFSASLIFGGGSAGLFGGAATALAHDTAVVACGSESDAASGGSGPSVRQGTTAGRDGRGSARGEEGRERGERSGKDTHDRGRGNKHDGERGNKHDGDRSNTNGGERSNKHDAERSNKPHGEDNDEDDGDKSETEDDECGQPATSPATVPGFPGGLAPASGPVPANKTRYRGTVTDAVTGLPIAGVCVYAGPRIGCNSPNLNTAADGTWAVDYPAGVDFTFNFEHPSYAPAQQVTGTTGTTINVRLQPI